MIKNITNVIFACLIAGILFNSCKKGSNNKTTDKKSTPPMQYTLNGTAVTYDNCFISTLIGTKFILVIGLDSKNPHNEFEIGITEDYAELSAGQTFPVKSNELLSNTAELYFSPDTTSHFISQPAVAEGSITITATNATTINGTFSGKLYSPDDIGGTNLKYTVTNGSFVAKRPTN